MRNHSGYVTESTRAPPTAPVRMLPADWSTSTTRSSAVPFTTSNQIVLRAERCPMSIDGKSLGSEGLS